MKICIFEDSSIPGLFPVNLLRHTSQIICGVHTIKEKTEYLLKTSNPISLLCRKSLVPYIKEIFPKNRVNTLENSDCLFLNSRIIYTKTFLDGLSLTSDELKDSLILHQKEIIAFCLSSKKISKLNSIINSGNGLISLKSLSQLNLKQIDLSDLNNDETEELKIIKTPAELINYFEEEIHNDLKQIFYSKKLDRKKGISAELINPSSIQIEPECKISKQVVLDASKGSIYISRNTTVEPFSYIVGPVYIGENSLIRSGSKLYGPVRIGNHSKVSGEIANSIFHSYVNKQHLGFIGHSYVCEWVNLGAGTTTSNLKNNYSAITIKSSNGEINTGSIFLGSIIGDHTKTGITTMLNTGTIIGISSNLYGAGYHPKFLNSFSWADASGKVITYDLEKAIQTANISMSRRKITMSKPYENLLRSVFKSNRYK